MKRFLSKEILIEEVPKTNQKASSGRVTKVKAAGKKSKAQVSGKTTNQQIKSIKVPPPTINPYNTMSNLQIHSMQSRKESGSTI